jgi:hypothetical protein
MEIRLPLAILVCSLFTLGCSDSSGPTNSSTTSELKGKIIDGYVKGATVFLDINNNGVRDNGEPYALSTDAGNYSLELSTNDQQCLDYVPIIVDVPIGAVDEDLGVITTPYQLVLPASKADVNESNHITPLTTLAWDAMSIELSKDYFEVGCEGIKNNTELHKQLLDTLDKSTVDLGGIYNLTPSQIYGDFIANGDTTAHQLAMNIVLGYQKSFAERADLIASGANVWSYAYTYLDATNLYQAEKDMGYKWLLNYAFARPTTHQREEQLVGTTLYKEGFTDTIHQHYERLDNTYADLDAYGAMRKYGVRAIIDDYDTPTYYCTTEVVIENIYTEVDTDFVSYRRSSKPLEVGSVNTCTYQPLSASDVDFEEIRRDKWNQKFAAGYIENRSPLAAFTLDDFSIIRAEIESWPIAWNETSNFTPQPSGWFKQITEDSATASVTTARNQNGYMHRTTTYSDGTYVRECPINDSVTYPNDPGFSSQACTNQ